MTLHDEHTLPASTCPVNQLEWLANHTLPLEEQAAIEAHLASCDACRMKASAWTELRRALREVSAQTPEPRADLFARIELQIDFLPTSWLHRLFQRCRFALSVCGEHFWAQARLLRRELFWIPLLLLPLICAIIYLPPPWQGTPGTAALLAALLTALGMAFLHGREVDPAREITLVTPTSPRLVLGIRCGLVFGYNLLLNCSLVLPFLTLQGLVTPAWFLTNWLAPLCCLSAIALLLSVLLNASIAVLVCAILWGLRLLDDVQAFLFGPPPQAPWQQYYESFWHQGTLLFVIALLAALLTFIVLERKERFARC